MNTMRFGMIGAGSISNAHLTALKARADVALVCIADLNQDLARKQAEKYGIGRVVQDYRELAEMKDIDAVIVGIPTAFHADAAMAAMSRGKHVLCEKPMARTVAECRSMIATADEHAVVLQIAFVRRFDPVWGQMRKLVQEGKVGRPCLWRRIVAGAAPQPPSYGTWYSDVRFSDGPLVESGSHDLDFLRYTFGDVKAVTASARHMSRMGDIQDTVSVILDFHSGDQVLFFWTWALPRGAEGFGGMDVFGPDGVIQTPVQIEGPRYVARVVKAGGHVEEHPFVFERDTTWFAAQSDNFIESIRGAQAPRASAHDGLKVQEIMEAAFESSRTGRSVHL